MKRRYSLPFRTATEASVNLGSWHYYREGDNMPVKMEGEIEGWDYNLDLQFFREISIDSDALKSECCLDPATRLQYVVIVKSPRSRYSEVLEKGVILPGILTKKQIEFSVDSSMLAETIELHTEVVMASDDASDNPFSASLRGSKLFEDRATVVLEGIGSRFPMESADFEKELAVIDAPLARYYLQWDIADLDMPVMSSMVLFLNSRYDDFVNKATNPDSPVSEMISADIARQLISGVIDKDDFVNKVNEFEEGSLGDVIGNMIKMAFPGKSVKAVSELRNVDRSRYEAMIQDGLGG